MSTSGIQVEEDNQLSIPRGGPIYISDMVGSLTRVHEFETAAVEELEKLKAELLWDFSEVSEEDISVNELKIISEEELVKMAFEEAFQDNKETGNTSEVVEEQSHTGGNHDGRTPIGENARLEGSGVLENAPVSHESVDTSPPETCSNVETDRNHDGRTPLCENARLEGSRASENAPVSHEPPDTSLPETCNDGESDRKITRKSKRKHTGKQKKPTSPPGTCNDEESDRKITKKRKRKHIGKKKKPTSPPGTCISGDSDREFKKKRKKGHTGNQKKPTTEEDYIAKVERIVEIKKKQDEERKSARLHSLETNKSANPSPDTTERLKVLKSMNSKMKVKPSNFHEHVPVQHPEVVLCVEVYHNKRTSAKTQEFFVLACQLLTELKDRITCLTDELMSKSDVHSTSGYFLIEDVFYNDMRGPSPVDYSAPILSWLRDSKDEALEKWELLTSGGMQKKQKAVLGSAPASQLPRFRTADMSKIRFCDLRFRLGAGYLYCHQGDCKHVIVIRDMRLIHPEDVQNRAAYPIVTYQSKVRFQKCSICNITRAEKVTVDDKWAPENPCFFCQNCYYMLHYVDRKLFYENFSVYDYFHD